jgi:basic membrane lipoprotein Med (substrate-binding protein (PBP1-ABC) superfamily)
MKDEGSALAPYHGISDKIPQEVKDAVIKAKADIMSGKLTVPFKEKQVIAD